MPTRLPLIRFREIVSEPLSPVVWVVEGLIAEQDRTLFYGEWGSLKTWLLLDLAVSIAAGTIWLGQFQVSGARHVLYLNEEDKEGLIRRRIKRLTMNTPLAEQDLPLRVLPRSGVRFDEQGAEGLLTALRASEFSPQVIIAEPLRALHSGDEISAKDMRGFWNNVAPLYQAGITLILSHHMRKPHPKGEHDIRNRASGSTDIMAGVDGAFALTRKAGNVVLVENPKLREAQEGERFVVSLESEGKDGPARLTFQGFEGDIERGLDGRRVRLVTDYLNRAEDRKAETQAILSFLASQGIAERTGSRLLGSMSQQGLVRSVRRGVWQLQTLAEAA